MDSKTEIHLKLTVADLIPHFREKVPKDPRFFHFMESKKPKDFQEATLITFTRPDGTEYVIKDLYNKILTK
jgi:hypothetical protein